MPRRAICARKLLSFRPVNHPESSPPNSTSHYAPGVEPPDRFASTVILRGDARQEQIDRAISEFQQRDGVVDRCQKCDALLDVTGCSPLTETVCPDCGALIKVLRDFHHFVLLSQIGQGGAGTVYRAFDETLERDVALKLLRNEHTRDQEFIEGLEREALITASLNHQHVVKVYSAGRQNGYYYIAMEIVSGGSLAQRMKRDGRLPEAAVLSVGIQLAEGLQAACHHGLLHRDVKPGNLLFSDQGDVKVADFGLALPISRTLVNAGGDVWGTPEYMAPEKLLRKSEDVRSDIYSVGCTLYHCLAGAPPLDLEKVSSVLERQTARPIPNIQNVVAGVSGEMAFVIKRCLEVNPAERYQDYEDLIKHLQYARDQLARPEAKPRSASSGQNVASVKTSSAARRPWKWVTAGVAILAIGTWLIVALTKTKVSGTAPSIAANREAPAAVPKQAPDATQSHFVHQISEFQPIGYWRLNESRGTTAADSSGNKRNGIYRSAVKLGYPDFDAIRFSGFASDEWPALFNAEENSFVSLPPLYLTSANVTFTIWIYPTTAKQAGATGLIFCRDGLGTVAGLQYDRDHLGYNWNNELKTYQWNSGLTLPANEWSLVALAVTSSGATIYLDNAKGQTSANFKNPQSQYSLPFGGETRIGNDSYGNSRTFKGRLCEAAIFGQALAAEQISTLYQAALADKH